MSEIMVAGKVGGREHGLGLALVEEGNQVCFTDGGNAGTQNLGENLDVVATKAEATADRAQERGVGLVIVGPEAPLVAGLADHTRARGIATFGPGAEGAQLEASKAWAANLKRHAGIGQPDYLVTESRTEAADHLRRHGAQRLVIKAEGLAAGKGAILPADEEEAFIAIDGILSGELFKDSPKRIVFQRRLDPSRPEFSAMYLVDGYNFVLLPLSQDHKRLLDGDKGPNTGGMGAYSPITFETPEVIETLLENGERYVSRLRARGINYQGVIYDGLMLDAENGDEPSSLEDNVRFGDPEIEVVLPQLKDQGIDVAELLTSVANGSLDKGLRGTYIGSGIRQSSITDCLASEGYPDSSITDRVIYGLEGDYKGVTIHYAGTKIDEQGQVLTAGGRVLYVTAVGENIDEAARRAYAAIGPTAIHFAGMQYREDIAWQARKAA